MSFTAKRVLIIILTVVVPLAVFAEDFRFKCGECHSTVKEVLPPGHTELDTFSGCFECHDQKDKAPSLGRAVHGRHLADMGITKETCLSCHKLNGDNAISVNVTENITIDEADIEFTAEKLKTYYEPGRLANSHKNAGEYCLSCHKSFDIDESENMRPKCVSCHGSYEDMAVVTQDSGFGTNPHKHHFPTLDCTKCHMVHEDFTDYCVKCHQWGFQWKQKITE